MVVTHLDGWDTSAPPPEQTPPYRLGTSTTYYKEHKPVRPADRRKERRRLERDRRYRARLAVLRDMREFFQLPQPRRPRRAATPPRVDRTPIVVVSSDTSLSDAEVAPPEQPPVIDLDSSLESLPNIDPRPQFQLPVERLVDLGPLDVTAVLSPQLQNQTLREAYVLLQRLQVPPLQPLTPPPELPPRDLTPQPDQAVDWVGLEAAVASFDGQHYIVLSPPLEPQQPEVASVPQHMPLCFAQPPPLPQVDWANIAYSLFLVAEWEHEARINNPN